MVTAHEADILYMRNFLEEITKNMYNQGGLTLNKPDTFESNEKSKLSFRQWSDEFSSWVERIDQDFEKMLRLAAQMQERDKDKFLDEAQQEYRLGAEKVAEFDKHIYLAMKRLTADIAREIVDTSKSAGEAWYRLTDRFYGRNVQGATAIASQLQELKRPTQIAESFHLLNVIRKLVREFARKSPKEPMPSAIVKAAYMRVVPETHRRAMETQVDVDKVEPHNLEDKVLAFIRNNTPGAAPMDIGNIAPGLCSSSQSATSSTQHNGDKIGTLATPTHQEIQMVSCTVCRKAKGRAKVEVSTVSATTVESQVIRPSSVMQKVEKQKERERRLDSRKGLVRR